LDSVIRVWLASPSDMEAAVRLLQQAGLDFQACTDIHSLIAQAAQEVGALLLEEEGLTVQALEKLNGFLSGQPPWSDLPVILLVKRVASTGPVKPWSQWIRNLTVVDRPVTSPALISVLRMALQARQRQHEVRDLLARLLELNRNLEQRVAERTAQLELSNKELEQFASIASHDLQEPLRTVGGFLRLLEERCQDKLDAKAKGYISYAADGAKRMSALITDLLKYSRAGGQDLVLASTNVDAVLGVALINLKHAIRDSGAVVAHDPLPTVMADAGQIAQVIQNLIGNAIKFRSADRQCQVHVSARKVMGHQSLGRGPLGGDGSSPMIDAPLTNDATKSPMTDDFFWLFSVRDNGIGIDPRFKDRIFLIFQRLHGPDRYEGTGIGLAICKKIVERHGGRIWVESTVGEGSAFCFTLPAQAKTTV